MFERAGYWLLLICLSDFFPLLDPIDPVCGGSEGKEVIVFPKGGFQGVRGSEGERVMFPGENEEIEQG